MDPHDLLQVEDAKSFGVKVEWAMQTMGLRGVAVASLGLEWSPGSWEMVRYHLLLSRVE